MRIAYFTHSLRSCWNHGNAHFLRGVLSELVARGHGVDAFEPEAPWSLTNLLADQGEQALNAFARAYPDLRSRTYSRPEEGAARAADADLVIVHEWNEPALVAALGRLRARGGRFTLLFHDTHHRAVSAPEEMRAYDLEHYDGVLAFGETIAEIYRRWGWGSRAFVWHEAADVRRFHPIPPRNGEGDHAKHGGGGVVQGSESPPSALPAETSRRAARNGLIWVGNWGDGERSEEVVEFLLEPARDAALPLDIYGVRYPRHARETLAEYGARYHGWIANADAPAAFARAIATVHVPRRFYSQLLPGIPTIRVFEALACGIPVVSAPWNDSEGLFRVGQDFLMVSSGDEMTRALERLKNEPELRSALAASGLETIRKRHTCAHRVDELLGTILPALHSERTMVAA